MDLDQAIKDGIVEKKANWFYSDSFPNGKVLGKKKAEELIATTGKITSKEVNDESDGSSPTVIEEKEDDGGLLELITEMEEENKKDEKKAEVVKDVQEEKPKEQPKPKTAEQKIIQNMTLEEQYNAAMDDIKKVIDEKYQSMNLTVKKVGNAFKVWQGSPSTLYASFWLVSPTIYRGSLRQIIENNGLIEKYPKYFKALLPK